MKGFFQWFKPSAKIKRWILMVLVGIIFLCYAISRILVSGETLTFLQVSKIIITFVIGFTLSVIGLIFLNKRTLELLIESTDTRMENKKNVNVQSLIFNKKVYDQGPKIVVIGGGNGLNTILEGMKKYTDNLTAIVAVSDYGEKSELEYQSLEDIKNGIASLAEVQNSKMKELLNYKFQKGNLKGISFQDIYFEAMSNIVGGEAEAVKESNNIFKIAGKVLPVTSDKMKICAELENGYVIEEKSRIPTVVYDKFTKINRIYLNPTNCRATPGVIEAIKEAEAIVIGPGSLYTNVIPNLLINGVTKAIKESKAIKLYVCNIMTDPGQTDNYSVSDHINAIIEHCGEGMIDYCLYDTGEIVPEFIKKYNQKGSELVFQDITQCKDKKIKYIKENLSTISDTNIRHNANIIASVTIGLICDDLRFKDMKNNPEYVMMSTKLKEDKRINKLKKKNKNKNIIKEKDKNKSRKSRFANKYSERIESIRTSDEKRIKRRSIEESKKDEKKIENQEKKQNISKNNAKMEKQKKGGSIKNKDELTYRNKEVVQENGKIELDSATLRPKDYHALREEMLKKFNESKLKD